MKISVRRFFEVPFFALKILFAAAYTIILFPWLFILRPAGSRYPHRCIAKPWSRGVLLFLGIKPVAAGMRANKVPAVYICNHLSYVDIFLIMAALPGNFKFMADTSLFRIPVLGIVLRLCGYIKVEHRGVQAVRRGLDLAVEAIGRGESILIFPEGGINRSAVKDQYRRIEYGFSAIAAKAGVHVKQLALCHTDVVYAGISRFRQSCYITELPEPLSVPLDNKAMLGAAIQKNHQSMYHALAAEAAQRG
jgi:1-acyl-sn-glycerol-3-phosphate acyltransferase